MNRTLPKLKSKIITNIILITAAVMLLEVAVFFWIQINNAERRAYQNADVMFTQIDQILRENEEELKRLNTEYRESCFANADTVSYILEADPSAAENMEKLKKIAKLVGVDEIHIFSPEGVIVSGTNPEYYGYSVFDGDQIGFFRAMLKDKSMRLAQDVTPNTAEGKMMQYSAVWSAGGDFILQVGMNPSAVLRATEKNELTYIFGLLNGGRGVTVYAVDQVENRVVGASDPNLVGKVPADLGLDEAVLTSRRKGFHRQINGVASYAITTGMENWSIVYVVTTEAMYQNLTRNAAFLILALLVAAVLLVVAVTAYIDRFVISSISEMNEELADISQGALDRTVNITGSKEFAELSSHINELIRTLLRNTEKISYILNQTNLPVGVYEYNTRMKKVRVTERVPGLLGLDSEAAAALFEDHNLFRKKIDELKQHAVEHEDNLFMIEGDMPHYLKLEETRRENDVFGVIVDMTDEINVRRRVESERDIDMLTGVLSRRRLKADFEDLIAHPETAKHGLVCMIDADGLKEINDSYGHVCGDRYLTVIADKLNTFGSRENLTGRLGGDEFVMFLYGYDTDEELEQDIRKLSDLQNQGTMEISDGVTIPIRFSIGRAKTFGNSDPHALLLSADQAMYNDKMNRKTRTGSDTSDSTRKNAEAA